MPLFKKSSPKGTKKGVEITSTLIPLNSLKTFLKKEKGNGYLTLRKQYRNLVEEATEEARNGNKASMCGTLLANVNKNRYRHILPYDRYRVILGQTWEEFNRQPQANPSCHTVAGNYINAAYIGACKISVIGEVMPYESAAGAEYIVTQDPLEECVGEFWQMVWEQRSPTIIRLTGALENDEDLRSYWPKKVGQRESYMTMGSKVCVEFINESQKPVWIERVFRIWPESNPTMSMFVRHMQYVGWVTNYSPPSDNLIKFIDDVCRPDIAIAGTAGPTIVQCRGGIGRNGFFITASLLKKNIEQGITGLDIYNVIKHLRKYQVGLVNSVEYYIELHKFAERCYQLTEAGGFKQLEYSKPRATV